MSDEIKITGEVIHVGELKTYGSNGFQKAEFVIKTDEEYPQEIPIECAGKKADLIEKVSVGESVDVYVNLRGNYWEKGERWFPSISAWRVVTRSGEGKSEPEPEPVAETDAPF